MPLCHSIFSQLLQADRSSLDPCTELMDPETYVCKPSRLFWSEILLPLQGATKSTTFIPAFHSFLDQILRQARVDLTSVFNPNFFTGQFLHSLFSAESWMVSANLPPSSTPSQSLHVYCLLASLRQYPKQPLILPSNGISLAEAKHIGVLTNFLFAMINLTEDFGDPTF